MEVKFTCKNCSNVEKINLSIDEIKQSVLKFDCYEEDSWIEDWYCDSEVEFSWHCTKDNMTYSMWFNEGGCFDDEDES